MDLFGVGVQELAVIIVLALIFVGPRDLPRLAAKAAKVLRDIRRMTEGISAEWQREVSAVDLDLSGVKELANELNAAQESVRKITTSTLKLDDVINPKPSDTPADGTAPAASSAEPTTPAEPTPSAEEPTTSDTANE